MSNIWISIKFSSTSTTNTQYARSSPSFRADNQIQTSHTLSMPFLIPAYSPDKFVYTRHPSSMQYIFRSAFFRPPAPAPAGANTFLPVRTYQPVNHLLDKCRHHQQLLHLLRQQNNKNAEPGKLQINYQYLDQNKPYS